MINKEKENKIENKTPKVGALGMACASTVAGKRLRMEVLRGAMLQASLEELRVHLFLPDSI